MCVLYKRFLNDSSNISWWYEIFEILINLCINIVGWYITDWCQTCESIYTEISMVTSNRYNTTTYHSAEMVLIVSFAMSSLYWSRKTMTSYTRHCVSHHQQVHCIFHLIGLATKTSPKLRISGRFVRGIRDYPVDSSHKGLVMRKGYISPNVVLSRQWAAKCCPLSANDITNFPPADARILIVTSPLVSCISTVHRQWFAMVSSTQSRKLTTLV